MISIDDIRAAEDRIRGRLRETPVMEATSLRSSPFDQGRLLLKLECLQVSGSFKARGATNTALSLNPDELSKGLVTASGGNHGLGVAYAGWMLDVPVTIFLPLNTPDAKVAKLKKDWGVDVVLGGDVWDDANKAALAEAERTGARYIHPFADAMVMAGQGTLALELLKQAPKIDTLLVSIGGGGLISGVATAVKALSPDTRIIGVEPVGAPTLHDSVRAGELVTLPGIETKASSLAPRRSETLNFDIIRDKVDDFLLVSDEEMADAARWLWKEMGISAELSAAAGIACLSSGKYRPAEDETVCSIICGTGADGIG